MTTLRHPAFPHGASRDDLQLWYRRNRERSREIFAYVHEDAYYERPIALRNPIVFYHGHFPAFSFNTLVKLAHGQASIDPQLEALFARGIDPEDEASVRDPADRWPSRERVQEFVAECDRRVEEALASAPLQDARIPQLLDGEAVLTILEHEQMHHETLLYMLHNLPHEKKIAPESLADSAGAKGLAAATVGVPAGRATVGRERRANFGWDNEFPQHTVEVPAFEIDTRNVTNGEYLEFVEATGAKAPHFWDSQGGALRVRRMFDFAPLPLDAPVYVTHEEAASFARWKGKRLPTEAEFHRAAYATPSGGEHEHPWGDEPADASRGNFDFAHLDPVAVGSYAPNAWGIYDLVGNGWEWTDTVFDGFAGFTPMPSYPLYSADFFDGAHYVMKGASPTTARELVRRTFRNWFRPNYPYVYATFRCVR